MNKQETRNSFFRSFATFVVIATLVVILFTVFEDEANSLSDHIRDVGDEIEDVGDAIVD